MRRGIDGNSAEPFCNQRIRKCGHLSSPTFPSMCEQYSRTLTPRIPIQPSTNGNTLCRQLSLTLPVFGG